MQITEPSTKQRENFKTKRKFSHKNKLGKMGGLQQLHDQKPKLFQPQICSLSLKKLAVASTIPSLHNYIQSWSTHLQPAELCSLLTHYRWLLNSYYHCFKSLSLHHLHSSLCVFLSQQHHCYASLIMHQLAIRK